MNKLEKGRTVLIIMMLNIILPTADMGTDLSLIGKLYRGVFKCHWTERIRRENDGKRDCENQPHRYCSAERVSAGVCGVKCENKYCCKYFREKQCRSGVKVDKYCLTREEASSKVCGFTTKSEYHCRSVNITENDPRLFDCENSHNYCSAEKLSAGVCGVKWRSEYYCKNFTWFSEYQDYLRCEKQGPDNYCSDPSSNEDICRGDHPKMGTAMLTPFCLNYIFCFIAFFRLGTDKKKTFIFPLLNLYPQYEAARLILVILRDPEAGMEKRRLYDQNIGLHETFIEAVPSSLILTYIWVSALRNPRGNLGAIIFEDTSTGIVDGVTFFLLTFSLSCFSACLGLAKCLKIGVARTIAPGGPVDGFLSGPFLMAVLASGCCLAVRGVCIGLSRISTVSIFTILFLPHLFLALCSTLDFTSRNSLKILISHPSLILLPVFTFFTFSQNQFCGEGDRRVKFSVKFTLINIAVLIVVLVMLTVSDSLDHQPSTIDRTLDIGSITLFAVISTLSCCSCFISAPEELSLFDPDQP